MKVLRRIVEAEGHRTTGSDASLCGHRASNVNNADLVVYTTAVGEDNCEVVQARRLGIPTVERAVFLGRVASAYQTTIAVSGSHGKTTATGFCASIFSGKNPTVHIGGLVGDEAGRIGDKDFFITEACEYKRGFLHLRPKVGIILNAELDHTDYYRDEADYFSAFSEFAQNCETVIVSAAQKFLCRSGGKEAFGRKEKQTQKIITFGVDEDADYQAKNIERTAHGYRFDFFEYGEELGQLEIGIEGCHNILNALAAAAAARLCSLSIEEIESGMKNFGGAKRRFERLCTTDECTVISDYAHHPSELAASLKTARSISGGKKVTFVFQPHTYTRLQSLLGDFAASLSKADRVILLPVFAAREKPLDGVSSKNLAAAVSNLGTAAVHIETFAELFEYLVNTLTSGEIVVFAGAGDIDSAAREFAKTIQKGA